MLLTDTHTHLYADQLKEDLEEVILRAKKNKVERLFLPNIDRSSVDQMLEMVDKEPEVFFPMMGLHPCSVDANYQKELDWMFDLLTDGDVKYVGVGEIGMDLYWDKTYVEQQRDAFRQQVNWAKELQLPIAIHTREAFDEIFAILDEENDDKLTGVFHCFTGTVEQAQKALSYGGFKLGIGGVLTFKKAGLDQVVQQLNLEDLVLETDSPYLSPAPYRGKRNESSYLLYIAEKLAEVKQTSLEEVATITTANSKSLFGV